MDAYIEKFDAIIKNTLDFSVKEDWLIRLEAQLREKIASHYLRADDTAAAAEEPYDEIYVYYLMMKYYEQMGDTGRYANARAAYEYALDELGRYYGRTYPQKREVRCNVFPLL